MILSFALIIVGFVLLIGGANLLVDGASDLASRLGLPDRVVGLTVVAIGTSLPELVVSIAAALEGHAEMAYGNVVGSCLANLLLILGLTALVKPVGLSRRTQRFEIPASVAAALVLLVASNTGEGLDLVEGVVMVAAFGAFVAYTAWVGLREGEDRAKAALDVASASGTSLQAASAMAGDGRELDEDEVPEANVPVTELEGPSSRFATGPVADLVLVAVGIVLLKFGADFVVENSVLVAGSLGVSERLIGITVIALGTCLPELVTSAIAAFKGNTDIAVGNVVGSNITNVLLAMGVPALFSPIVYAFSYNIDFALLAIFSVVLVGFAFVGTKHTMTRREGVFFVFIYIIYIVASAVL